MHASVFWREREEYHDLVEEYERNIEVTHPDYVTSRRMCPCLKYCSWCGWATTSVVYYEHKA